MATNLTSKKLIEQIKLYNPKADFEKIREACEYSKQMHGTQKRRSGEPYYTHPLEVALIMAKQTLDDATVITALLHDVLEDTPASFDDIKERFGREVAELVDGVTKLTNLEFSTATLGEEKQGESEIAKKMAVENLKKFLIASSKDLRVLIVKLGDRLHNMRTISHMPQHKQVIKAQETMDIYAPLAARMGMQSIREELEDLSFNVLNHEARTSIMRRFIKLKQQRDDFIPRITQDIEDALAAIGITAQIYGREKRPFSIWQKMQKKERGFETLSDIYGFRIVARDESDVYPILGAVHKRYKAMPGRFKDYISQPKPNGYQSIHTTVSGSDGRMVEIQIRTDDMHRIAEFGVAAHWSYREGKRDGGLALDPLSWFATVKENIDHIEDHEDFVENVKLEMFTNQIFCFTPKGEVISLAKGAGPIDFAYAIHTALGNQFISAMVDGQPASRSHRLRNGQSVEIKTAKAQAPQESWLQYANTSLARREIRRALRVEERKRLLKIGKEQIRLAFKSINKHLTLKGMDTAILRLGLKTRDSLFVAIGDPNESLTPQDLIHVLYPELAKNSKLTNTPTVMSNQTGNLIGLGGERVAQSAPCCQPLPGERIIGIAKAKKDKKSGKIPVLIHRIDCAVLEGLDAEEWIDLSWAQTHHIANNLVTLELTIVNDTGVLGRICTLIGEQNANITDLVFTEKRNDFYRIETQITVRDVEHLYHILSALQADSDISGIVQKKRQAKLI